MRRTSSSIARPAIGSERATVRPSRGPPGEVPVNRTDAIGFMGGAQNTNEECYLFQKAARLLGLAYVEHQARL